jgi:hypothetical protein
MSDVLWKVAALPSNEAILLKNQVRMGHAMFSQSKVAIFWILFTAAVGLGIFKGKGVRVAVWISGNRHPLSRQASVIRWCLVVIAVVMVWQGWRLTMKASVDILLVVVGSCFEIAGLYMPDVALRFSSGLDRLLGKPNIPYGN